MQTKLKALSDKYEMLSSKLQMPGIVDDQKKYTELMKQISSLEKIVMPYRAYKKLLDQKSESLELLSSESDKEMIALAKEELSDADKRIPILEQELKILLLPKNPNDEKNIILEIRSGAGGDEAALFAEELFDAYKHFATKNKWIMQIMDLSHGNAGGVKEVIASISGEKVYSIMKFESGVHRVQRVPKTETQGRVHTSTITVAVIPEVEEVDVKLKQSEIRVDTYRSSGKGGQSVNTTDSAVRLTHIPTGIIVTCQDGKSQLSNKESAMKVLASRLQALEDEKALKEASDQRIAQIGTGDRSERIRTYNFPQTRITDHRIGLTIHRINEVMSGNFEEVIDPLITHFQSEALKQQKNEY